MTDTWDGGRYSATTVHHVAREAVSEFARAVGATSPAHHDPQAARDAGFADVVAPPTFPIVFLLATQEQILANPELGFDYSRVVHREQQFTHHRPIHAGDRLSVTMSLTSIETLQGNAVAAFVGRLDDADGACVCTTRATLVSRAPSGEEPS